MDVQEDGEQKKTKLEVRKGDEYEGERRGGKAHGKGKVRWARGGLPVRIGRWTKKAEWAAGVWQEGVLNGLAVVKLNEGWYRGEVKDGLVGRGVLEIGSGTVSGNFMEQGCPGKQTFQNGDVFKGMVQGSEVIGQYVWSSGESFSGTMEQDSPSSFGVKQGDGLRFTGELTDGMFNKGLLQFHGRDDCYDAFRGSFKDNKFHGPGIYQFANGDYYKGEFRDGKAHGQAEFQSSSGNRFEGDWVDDKVFKGSLRWSDSGHAFEGELDKDGKPSNVGKRTFPDGSVWEGPFRNGNPHGQGTFTFPENSPKAGTTLQISFIDGVLQGQL